MPLHRAGQGDLWGNFCLEAKTDPGPEVVFSGRIAGTLKKN